MMPHDDSLREELLRDRTPLRPSDWGDVVRRAGRRRSRRGLAVFVLAAVALGAGATALAQTTGRGFGDWVRGGLGEPLGAAERDRFRSENERSIAPLARETDVRELLRIERDGVTYRLLGFRTGPAVCLKLAGSEPDEGGDVSCVPADELALSGDLAVPLRVDAPLREYRPGAPAPELATYGLVAAETRSLILETEAGAREARLANGAFLSISGGGRDAEPTVGAFAVDDRGRRRRVPLAPSLREGADRYVTGLPATGPAGVERRVVGGSIGWVDRRTPRGAPLPDALRRFKRGTRTPFGEFTRVIRPDPDDFVRFAVGVPDGGDDLCFWEISRGGIGGGCNDAERMFASAPFTGGWTYAGAGSQLVTAAGLATDDVARLVLYLGNGERRAVALRDNVYFARVQRAKFPARLVAYDREGRVIGVQTMRAM